MKNWIANISDKVFVLALSLLIAVSFIAVMTSSTSLMTYSLLLFIPLFLILYFSKYKYLTFSFIAFLLFSFLGDASCLFFEDDALIKASSVFYFLGFMYLLIMVLPKFKLSEVQSLVGGYLIGVFSIVLFFLFQIYQVLQDLVNSIIELQLFGAKSLSLVLLGFISFGVYLNTQTKKSGQFLIATVSLSFSVALNYVSLYYVHHLEFVVIERLLYATALYFLFKYTTTNEEDVSLGSAFNRNNVLV
ncbi:hypothetical protein [Aestuariibaculum suncheonense]|uniref:YhhN-like protein n=1 Tax=Aestuariibaculum suncheonense TaxID=1028745 RepID=A0A8J6QFW3_9FLAO|nr:hypothetical protein [Aestuariibaculum suncheonense]MBD0835953.1 hypothetical protein [Aestuariibaculum suncheonense]